MKILVAVAYAGSKKLVEMTNEMLRSFADCATFAAMQAEFVVVAINNKADKDIDKTLVAWHAWNETNEGFGRAISLAIEREVFNMDKAGTPQNYTHVLVLNNDLVFDHRLWLYELLRVAAVPIDPALTLVPCTDVTATKDAVAAGPREIEPFRVAQASAFCWLVPVPVVKKIRKKFGFTLFHPDFSNYGSDDVTGAILRSLVSAKPFKIVPRSWVKHLKAQTANELGVKAGTKELLQRIANFKRTRRLS